MKLLSTLLLLLITSAAKAQSFPASENEFLIEFKNCVRVVAPIAFKEMTVDTISPYTMSCTQSDKLFFCDIKGADGRNEVLYFDKKEGKQSSLQLQFGSGNNYQLIDVSERMATLTKVNKTYKSFVINETCQGIFTSKEDVDRIQKIDLSLGFKNIIKDL